jgi:plastocyanin
MRRIVRSTVVVALGWTSLLALGAAPAVAGGGCHDPATATDAGGRTETTVEMKDACFRPTALYVDPGTAVTFVSHDAGMTHNVGGNAWGHLEDMGAGDAFRATFDEVGTYPYACSYHPGMTGAIVVGDGVGNPDGGWVSIEPYVPAEPVLPTGTAATSMGTSSLLLIGAAGVALGAAIVWTVGRRRSSAGPG